MYVLVIIVSADFLLTSNVSMIDLTFSSKRQTTPEDINDVVRQACVTSKLKNVLS